MSQWTDDLFYVFVYFQESQIKRIFGTMINQKLQDFEEDVKPLGDLMTQVNFHAYRIYSINRPGRLLNFWTLRVGAYSRLGAY